MSTGGSRPCCSFSRLREAEGLMVVLAPVPAGCSLDWTFPDALAGLIRG
jgi:hypothetical protein